MQVATCNCTTTNAGMGFDTFNILSRCQTLPISLPHLRLCTTTAAWYLHSYCTLQALQGTGSSVPGSYRLCEERPFTSSLGVLFVVYALADNGTASGITVHHRTAEQKARLYSSTMADDDITFDFEHQLEEAPEPLAALPVSGRCHQQLITSELRAECACAGNSMCLGTEHLSCIYFEQHAVPMQTVNVVAALAAVVSAAVALHHSRQVRMAGVACSWQSFLAVRLSRKHPRRKTTDRWVHRLTDSGAAMQRPVQQS